MSEKIRTLEELQRWARVRMAIKGTNGFQLAKGMGIAYPRISEALHGKPRGRKHIIPLIEELGGDPEDFKEVLRAEYGNPMHKKP